jgi:RHH-type proline utilization regulon transcriptional repressor/proline dehydrogenase/delta 1-pyrroline-5-carboxylate dehydrogenase
MDDKSLERLIRERGREFFESVKDEESSVFNKGWWTGKVMDWSMKNEDFKVQLFRFVDVLPYLNSSASLSRHIEEYFAGDNADIPPVLKWGAEKSGRFGALGRAVVSRTIRSNIESLGKTFIIGQDAKEAVKSIRKLRKDGFAFTADFLGEATVSEAEADAYLQGYLDLLDALEEEHDSWTALEAPGDGGDPSLDWGRQPKVHVSVKPSALYSQAKPVDVEGSVQGILSRLRPLYRKVRDCGGSLCIDMEQLKYREITLECFKRLRADPEFADYPHLAIVLQAYLRATDADLDHLVDWSRSRELPISVRLVKGAYWDYETVLAKQNGWEVPVYTVKAETDTAFERLARRILENSDHIYFMCGSHNIRSIAMVLETARAMNIPDDRYEFQVLYGMAEPVRKGLRNVAGRVRLYAPFGELIPGMAYLVRRLLENTANESFLRQSFAEGEEIDQLMEDPRQTLERISKGVTRGPRKACRQYGDLGCFANEPAIDFTIPANRRAFAEALDRARQDLGQSLSLHIDGRDVSTDDTIESRNPADPDEVVGRVCQAGTGEIDAAVAAASRVLPAWRDTAPRERAGYLVKAADAARKRIFDLAAAQVLEIGKQWDQAYHDVTEAIDFMEYYAREMVRLAAPRRMGNAPGESNHYFYQPRGVAAVIAPWNFPLAISAGMVSAAVVTGNPVVYKPSHIASVVGRQLVDLFAEAGLPDGVFNYCPGRSRIMGDHLITHPDVALIAFTGSMDVGLHIQKTAARVVDGQLQCRKVITEMGGKNAIIVDDDADLDEAVTGVVYSAFGFQGQKCSACSRVIVLDEIYDRFVTRLKEACQSLKIGPAEDPANFMGPVADKGQQETVNRYVDLAASEGEVLVRRQVPDDKGCYVPLTVVTGIEPAHRIAREEVFGPVLAVMRAPDFDAAVEMANSTRYALTGAVYSRSPKRLEQARREFRVGNLYLNRGSTGALVWRQPFGGFNMSGIGSKTGGPDYLVQFMDPRCTTENTMRRGFAPIEEGDDWVA